MGQSDPSQGAEQDIGHGGEPEAQLVGAHGSRRGPVGEQVELAFLDPVFHVAARAVDRLVERTGLDRCRVVRDPMDDNVWAPTGPVPAGSACFCPQAAYSQHGPRPACQPASPEQGHAEDGHDRPDPHSPEQSPPPAEAPGRGRHARRDGPHGHL